MPKVNAVKQIPRRTSPRASLPNKWQTDFLLSVKSSRTSIIASETIVEKGGGNFAFRLLDRVAVKGKSEAIRIYELLGREGESEHWREIVAAYEKAFAAYAARDFPGAIGLLAGQQSDGPSANLLERCRVYLEEPPPQGWEGVYVSKMK